MKSITDTTVKRGTYTVDIYMVEREVPTRIEVHDGELKMLLDSILEVSMSGQSEPLIYGSDTGSCVIIPERIDYIEYSLPYAKKSD